MCCFLHQVIISGFLSSQWTGSFGARPVFYCLYSLNAYVQCFHLDWVLWGSAGILVVLFAPMFSTLPVQVQCICISFIVELDELQALLCLSKAFMSLLLNPATWEGTHVSFDSDEYPKELFVNLRRSLSLASTVSVNYFQSWWAACLRVPVFAVDWVLRGSASVLLFVYTQCLCSMFASGLGPSGLGRCFDCAASYIK